MKIYQSSISKYTIFKNINKSVYPEFKDWETYLCPYCKKQFDTTVRKYNCNAKNWLIHISMKHRGEIVERILELLYSEIIYSKVKQYDDDKALEEAITDLRNKIYNIIGGEKNK